MKKKKQSTVDKDQAIALYDKLLFPRMIEEKMLLLLRQGKISKWFSGIGQEAISVGCTAALQEDEVIFPMHRNLAVFTGRGMSLFELFCQWQGNRTGYTKGRDRSFHFGSMKHHVVGMISHLGPQMALACGVALSHKLRNEAKVSLAFTGEGGTSEGDFHEALNVAAVWELPVIFIVENNGYGLSTPTSEQYRCKQISDKGIGYGIESITIDGNNIEEVYTTISEIAKKIRKKPQPFLVECMTFRMRGHEEASGTKYVPQELLDQWAKRDPLSNYEKYLIDSKILGVKEVEAKRAEYAKIINQDLDLAFQESNEPSSIDAEESDVFAEHKYEVNESHSGDTINARFIDAIKNGLDLAMTHHSELVLMGQDIAEYGGVFKITEGFIDKYGKERVRNTPICESAIVGIGLGLSLRGMKSMVEMQFADFATCGFNQIVNNLAKVHYRWGQQADVVIRMPAGGGVGAGPFHSQTNEAWFAHVPGLKIAYPSNPYDAKGLLLEAFRDPNPVIYFEHKALYRKISDDIPEGYYTIQFGQARLARTGEQLSIITYGMGVHWAMEAIDEMGIDAEVLDMRTIVPLDYKAIEDTVKKTGRILVLQEANLFSSVAGEISAYINENFFEYLDAPVLRCGGLATPIPFAKDLESLYQPQDRLREKLTMLLEY